MINNMENTKFQSAKELINYLFKLQISGDYIFRGISNRNQLYPTIIREFVRNQSIQAEGWLGNIELDGNQYLNLKQYELWILNEYGKYSNQYLPNFYTCLDFVASAQHFGLPTRLIDWTHDPFCAAYFSTFYKEKLESNEKFEILVSKKYDNMYFDEVPDFPINASPTNRERYNNKYLNQYRIFIEALEQCVNAAFTTQYFKGTPQEKFKKQWESHINSDFNNKKYSLFFCSVYDSNPRVIAQKGLFQVPRRIHDMGKLRCIEEDVIGNIYEIVEIEEEQRLEVLEYINKINMTTPRLFPDLQNICQYLKSGYKFKQFQNEEPFGINTANPSEENPENKEFNCED